MLPTAVLLLLQIGLVCHLLGVSGRALVDLPGLIGLSLGTQLASNLALIPLLVSSYQMKRKF